MSWEGIDMTRRTVNPYVGVFESKSTMSCSSNAKFAITSHDCDSWDKLMPFFFVNFMKVAQLSQRQIQCIPSTCNCNAYAFASYCTSIPTLS
jgi:hypothetical protein